MAITIGLDFGTHQTKICIENSDSPLHKTYEFFEWDKGVYAFPSIIQIKKDHTLQYGSIDLNTCLIARKKKKEENPGELSLPPKPFEPDLSPIQELNLPPQPTLSFVSEEGMSMSIPYQQLYGIGRPLPRKNGKTKNKVSRPIKLWRIRCQKLKLDYEKRKWEWIRQGGDKSGLSFPEAPTYPQKPNNIDIEEDSVSSINPLFIASTEQKEEYKAWQYQCTSLKKQYKKTIEHRDRMISQYNKDVKKWEDECNRLKRIHKIKLKRYNDSLVKYPLVYRYFKQATFSAYIWDYEIKAQDLTVLYLANIIFKLEERFGTDFSIQMGIPASKATFNKLKPLASGYLIQAIRLVEDVFQNNSE